MVAGTGSLAQTCSRGTPPGQIGVAGVEGQEVEHRAAEPLDVVGRLVLTAADVGIAALRVLRGGTLSGQVRAEPVPDGLGCPDPVREGLAADLLLDRPG